MACLYDVAPEITCSILAGNGKEGCVYYSVMFRMLQRYREVLISVYLIIPKAGDKG